MMEGQNDTELPGTMKGRLQRARTIYLTMETPWRGYLLRWVAVPTTITAFAVYLLLLLFPDAFSDIYLRVILYLLPAYILISMLLKPVLDYERRSHRIDQEIHLFITRIGVLSVSNISQEGMFSILSEMKEYGELAKEVTKVFNLVDRWGISLGEACRIVAHSTPSRLFSDFLNRLAHAIDSGEPAGTFFKNEQKVIMDEYQVNYEKSLYGVEVMKEMFVAMVTTAAFIFVIVSLYPMLTGEDASTLLVLTLFIFAFVEFVFLYFLASIIPEERIWQSSDIKTEVNRKINRYLIAGVASTGLIGIAFLIFRPDISLLLIFAITFTPLMFPAFYVNQQESEIKGREKNFAAFIRSLGSSSAGGAYGMSGAMKRLKGNDFGPLTKNIIDLQKRLSMHIDSRRAWRLFGAESGSDITLKFSEMFLEGAMAGGDARDMSQIISDNFNRILGLRMRRYASASTLVGLLYGVAIAVAFALYLSAKIVNWMGNIYSTIDIPKGYEGISVLHPVIFQSWVLTTAIALILLTHATISSVMTRVIGGGHKAGALLHIPGLLWTGAIMEMVVNWMMGWLI